MPHNKNQHYVPRCLLKPFTLRGEGLSISLLNIARGRVISSAPAKHQCSRDYLYDHGGDLEKALSTLEGTFASIVRRLQSGGSPDDDDRRTLLLFFLIQWRRTEAAIDELNKMMEDWKDQMFVGNEGQRDQLDMPHRELVQMSMRIGVDCVKYASDLKLVIIRNRTEADFIISDNPAVVTNRLHIQKWNVRDCGIQNSGTILTMPLGPKLGMIAYDRAAYTMQSTSGIAECHRSEDVMALNELQVLAASSNIYFAQPGDTKQLFALLDNAKPERGLPTFKTAMLILDEAAGTSRTYRYAKPEEMADATVSHSQRLHRKPQSWFSPLGFRNKIKTHSNGTGLGHVRKAEWLKPDNNPPRPLRLQPAKSA